MGGIVFFAAQRLDVAVQIRVQAVYPACNRCFSRLLTSSPRCCRKMVPMLSLKRSALTLPRHNRPRSRVWYKRDERRRRQCARPSPNSWRLMASSCWPHMGLRSSIQGLMRSTMPLSVVEVETVERCYRRRRRPAGSENRQNRCKRKVCTWSCTIASTSCN